jgi:hypothetical protein
MNNHVIKSADQLSDIEIGIILTTWQAEEWLSMDALVFREKFKRSVFHLLTDTDKNILSLVRINNDFALRIREKVYAFAEFVGFVAVEKQKRYGSFLLQEVINEAKLNGLQMIGFCEKELRGFYQKNNIEILAGKARSILERENGGWISSTDDDILVLNLTEENKKLLNGLGEEYAAYLEC